MRSLTLYFLLFALLVSEQGLTQQSTGSLAAESQRSMLGRKGLALLNKEAAGSAFLSACRKSAVIDANVSLAGLTPEVIGGHCACIAGYYFIDQQSPFYGRMQAITRRAASTTNTSIMLASIADAKANGDQTKAAFAAGFAMEAILDCKASHLDIKGRVAAEQSREKERLFSNLVQSQTLSSSYIERVEKIASRYSGSTVVTCGEQGNWPNIYESMFIIKASNSTSDAFDGWLTSKSFDKFIYQAAAKDDSELRRALPEFESAAKAADEITFSEPYKLVTQGDFYRIPVFEDRKEVGYTCLNRAENGVSYFAGYPAGGKAMSGINSFLNNLSSSQDQVSSECKQNVNTRQFRETGGALLNSCKVAARGDNAQAFIRSALIDLAKRNKAAPELIRRTLDKKVADRQSKLRF